MKAIALSGAKAAGRVALIDDEDYELVSPHTWRVSEARRKNGRIDGPYAMTNYRPNGSTKSPIGMHMLITGWPMTDHRDGDGLNNQRSNLRPADAAQNNHNARPRAEHSSRYKGVTWHRRNRKWQATIKTRGRSLYLGCYVSEEEAGNAYAEAALAIQGDYAFAARPEPGPRPQILPEPDRPARRGHGHGGHTGPPLSVLPPGIAERYIGGEGVKALACEIGISEKAVRRRLRALGIAVRGPAEAAVTALRKSLHLPQARGIAALQSLAAHPGGLTARQVAELNGGDASRATIDAWRNALRDLLGQGRAVETARVPALSGSGTARVFEVTEKGHAVLVALDQDAA